MKHSNDTTALLVGYRVKDLFHFLRSVHFNLSRKGEEVKAHSATQRPDVVAVEM